MDFGHGGAMVEPSRGFLVSFAGPPEGASLDKNRAGQEVARRSLQRRYYTRDCQTACSFLARAQLRPRRVNLDSAADAQHLARQGRIASKTVRGAPPPGGPSVLADSVV